MLQSYMHRQRNRGAGSFEGINLEEKMLTMTVPVADYHEKHSGEGAATLAHCSTQSAGDVL